MTDGRASQEKGMEGEEDGRDTGYTDRIDVGSGIPSLFGMFEDDIELER